MLYAKIVVSKLAVEGPFDYFVPKGMEGKIRPGCRVWVSFREKRLLGYVVNITKNTNIKKIKPIEEVIESLPILNEKLLKLTKDLANYYCCTWSEMIETAIPQALRKGKVLSYALNNKKLNHSNAIIKHKGSTNEFKKNISRVKLVWDLGGEQRWDFYFKKISDTLCLNKGIIFLVSEISLIETVKDRIYARFKEDIAVLHRQQSPNIELEQWLKIKNGVSRILVATRCGVFAPMVNLGLIIIEDEDNQSYKQDQTPHYHTRQVAIMRADLEKVQIILGSQMPSLESYYLTYRKKSNQIILNNERPKVPIRIVDMRQENFIKRKQKTILSSILENNIQRVVESKGKVLLFLNRLGFATNIHCRNCGFTLTCERCNSALVYHFSEKKLVCHYCSYKILHYQICPKCKSGYLIFSGLGTEKLESELHRLFPQVNIGRLESGKKETSDNWQIFIATQNILKEKYNFTFDLVGIVNVDASLNRIDFRAAEKTFSMFYRLHNLADKEMIIQTYSNVRHYCTSFLKNDDPFSFYRYELKLRKKVGFPPLGNFIKINLRGISDERVKAASLILEEKMKAKFKDKDIEIFPSSPAVPSKKRNKFYWQFLLKTKKVEVTSLLLKKVIDNFRRSDIIITVDVDPL